MGFFLIHLLLTLLVAIILIISVQAIQTHIRNKASGFRAKYGYFLLFPLSHLLCTLLYFRLVQTLSDEDFEHYIGQHPFIEVFLIIVFSFCLLLDFSIIFIIDRMESTEQKNVQNEKLLLQNQLNYESTLLLREEKREFQKIKHDFANILTVAQGYIEIGNTDKALSALASMQVNLAGIAGFSLCSSETLNVILYIKKTQAANVGVTLIPEIQETCGIQIEDYDLCRVLFNLIDNCLHAVELLSADKSFSIHIQVGENEVSIHTRNRFLPEQTHRRKEDGHGNGVQIIREICAKYGGTYFAHTADDVYYTETVMQNRMPAEKNRFVKKAESAFPIPFRNPPALELRGWVFVMRRGGAPQKCESNEGCLEAGAYAEARQAKTRPSPSKPEDKHTTLRAGPAGFALRPHSQPGCRKNTTQQRQRKQKPLKD